MAKVGRVIRYALAAIFVGWLLWLGVSLLPWIAWAVMGD